MPPDWTNPDGGDGEPTDPGMPSMAGAPTEPAADLRQMASVLRQTFLALVGEGFTERQALTVVGQIITGGMGQGGGS